MDKIIWHDQRRQGCSRRVCLRSLASKFREAPHQNPNLQSLLMKLGPHGPEHTARQVPTSQQPQSLLGKLGLLLSQSTAPGQIPNSPCLLLKRLVELSRAKPHRAARQLAETPEARAAWDRISRMPDTAEKDALLEEFRGILQLCDDEKLMLSVLGVS